jgi:hypothetical protein
MRRPRQAGPRVDMPAAGDILAGQEQVGGLDGKDDRHHAVGATGRRERRNDHGIEEIGRPDGGMEPSRDLYQEIQQDDAQNDEREWFEG